MIPSTPPTEPAPPSRPRRRRRQRLRLPSLRPRGGSECVRSFTGPGLLVTYLAVVLVLAVQVFGLQPRLGLDFDRTEIVLGDDRLAEDNVVYANPHGKASAPGGASAAQQRSTNAR